MTRNEIAMMHLLIQRLEGCAAAYVSCAKNFPEKQKEEIGEYAKRLLTAAECFRMDLLEEELIENIGWDAANARPTQAAACLERANAEPAKKDYWLTRAAYWMRRRGLKA